LNARCVEVLKVTHDVKAFRFELADGQPLDYRPGQFVTLEVEIDGKKVFRSYTMSSTPTHQGSFEITIKRVDGGVLSNWACDKLKVGAQVRMTGPHGQFTCAPKPPKKLLFLSAGSGVTPMLSMARWLLATKKDCDVKFFHCARTSQDLIFGAEIKAMAQQSKKFTQFVSLTRAKPGSKWAGLKGHLDQAMLETVAPDFREREVFICGPDGFMASTQALLQGLDFPMAHYHAESFDVSSGISTEGGSVLFAESGVEVPCTGQQTILEVAEAAGWANSQRLPHRRLRRMQSPQDSRRCRGSQPRRPRRRRSGRRLCAELRGQGEWAGGSGGVGGLRHGCGFFG
jgi:ferredoxin-NADP reductase